MRSSVIAVLGIAFVVGLCWCRLERRYWLEFTRIQVRSLADGSVAQADHELTVNSDWIPEISNDPVYRTYGSSWNPINTLDFGIVYKGSESDLGTFRITNVSAQTAHSEVVRFRCVKNGKYIEHSQWGPRAICEAWAIERNVISEGKAQIQSGVIRGSSIREMPVDSYDVTVHYLFRGNRYEGRFAFVYRTELRDKSAK